MTVNGLDDRTTATVRFYLRDLTPQAFVACIPRGRVVGDCGDVISPDGYWLADLTVPDPRYIHGTHVFVERSVPPARDSLPGSALVLAQRWALRNYFHWMFNCLTRVQLCRLAGVDLDSVEHVIVNNRAGYRNETLERTGVSLARLVECDETFHAKADRVIATSNLWYAHMLSWAHEFLRETFLPSESPAGGPDRIYVERGATTWRPLINEPECIDLLERHGFTPVRLTGMTVANQAALFAGARCVAAPHDAGLTNLVFCRPGTTVLELFSPEHLRVYFAEVCAVRELDYHCLFGEAVLGSGASNPYRVPLDSLARLLEAAGL